MIGFKEQKKFTIWNGWTKAFGFKIRWTSLFEFAVYSSGLWSYC